MSIVTLTMVTPSLAWIVVGLLAVAVISPRSIPAITQFFVRRLKVEAGRRFGIDLQTRPKSQVEGTVILADAPTPIVEEHTNAQTAAQPLPATVQQPDTAPISQPQRGSTVQLPLWLVVTAAALIVAVLLYSLLRPHGIG